MIQIYELLFSVLETDKQKINSVCGGLLGMSVMAGLFDKLLTCTKSSMTIQHICLEAVEKRGLPWRSFAHFPRD